MGLVRIHSQTQQSEKKKGQLQAIDFALKAKKERQSFYRERERRKYQLLTKVLEGFSHMGMVGKIGKLVEGDNDKGLRILPLRVRVRVIIGFDDGRREEASGNASHVALSVRA